MSHRMSASSVRSQSCDRCSVGCDGLTAQCACRPAHCQPRGIAVSLPLPGQGVTVVSFAEGPAKRGDDARTVIGHVGASLSPGNVARFDRWWKPGVDPCLVHEREEKSVLACRYRPRKTGNVPMTSRERILAALEHRETDRVPIDFAGTGGQRSSSPPRARRLVRRPSYGLSAETDRTGRATGVSRRQAHSRQTKILKRSIIIAGVGLVGDRPGHRMRPEDGQ